MAGVEGERINPLRLASAEETVASFDGDLTPAATFGHLGIHKGVITCDIQKHSIQVLDL